MSKSTFNKPNSIDKFAIYPKLSEITTTVGQSFITFISAPQGTGKTLAIPYYLSKYNYTRRQYRSYNQAIFCANPSTNTTTAAFKYHRQFLDRHYLGCAYEGNYNYQTSTKLIYCTTHHLLNRVQKTIIDIKKNQPLQWFCSIIILDDFHTRTRESDHILCFWIEYYNMWKTNPHYLPRPPKLVIVANFGYEQIFADIVDSLDFVPSKLQYQNQTLQISNHINVVYDDVSDEYDAYSAKRYVRAAQLALQYQNDDYLGNYLIFVPGKKEMEIVAERLVHTQTRAKIISVHSEYYINRLDMYDADQSVIYIATNIAESSAKLHNVTLIIDTLTHRQTFGEFDEDVHLDITWISKMNSVQRAAKICAHKKGTYVVLMGQAKYAELSETILPSTQRLSILQDMLKIIDCHISPDKFYKPILNIHRITQNLEMLTKLQLITHANANTKFGTYYLTELGKFCCAMPLDIRKSMMLYYLLRMPYPDNLFLHVLVICSLNCYGSGFVDIPRQKFNEDIQSYQLLRNDALQNFAKQFEGYSDIDTIYNVWLAICRNGSPFSFKRVQTFCASSYINFKTVWNSILMFKQCIAALKKLNPHIQLQYYPNMMDQVDVFAISEFFYELLTTTHADLQTTITRNRYGIIATCGNCEYKINMYSVHNMNVANNPNKIYYCVVQSRRNTRFGQVRIIDVLHALPVHNIDTSSVISIFSSDVGSDYDSERENDLQYDIQDDIHISDELEMFLKGIPD